MKHFIFLFLFSLLASACTDGKYPDGSSRYQSFAPDGVEFRIADSTWNIDMRGNHRALVSVADSKVDAVSVILPWRRPDLRIETKKIIVCDNSDREVKDVRIISLTPEKGQLVFRPVPGISEYYIYYMPFVFRHGHGDARYGKPWNDYLVPEYETDPEWAASTESNPDIPAAEVRYFESCSKFNFWTPMGLIATAEETAALKDAVGTDMVIFPEDRAFPIQLRNQLPSRWNKVPGHSFTGGAMKNEYYVWQLGIWAAGKDIKNVKVVFSDLKNGDAVITSSEITCFNQEGINWDAKPVEFTIDVPESKVQALWCGVQIPEDAKPGTYKGTATVRTDNAESQVIDLNINVSAGTLADKGDSELWRHSRLRWLNSTIAQDNEPVAPFEEMILDGNRIEATGKNVTVGPNGMVRSITTHGNEVLATGQRFVVSTYEGEVSFTADDLNIHKDAAGLVSWTASSLQEGINFRLSGNMEFDGHLHFDILVSSEKEIAVKDVKLITEYTAYASEYYMGCGVSGGYRPVNFSWDWTGPFDSYWTGGPQAGLHTEFRGGTYHGPLMNDYKPAPTPVWSNGGLGRVTVRGAEGKPATVTASTGKNVLSAVPINYEFNLLITPVKELTPNRHFSEKYFHANPADYDKAAEDGCNVSNIHHAQALNPYINYPFIVREPLVNHIRHQHENGRKVKLYYTIRELTTLCEEVYAFHSLNHEVFASGVGYGLPWECEHLIDDYKPAWYTSNENLSFEPDAALVLTGNSRFINYWLEGLRWMEENYDLDGIYMDDVSFDRTTVKRIRKILDRYHDGALIDLHSNTGYSKGPANQYTEFFPYVNRLWFGESFQYDRMSPDEWFVTFSGIPFGEMSEMLQDGGNRFLGMVYGATARHSWTDTGNEKSPVPVWKFWDEFGISEAEMLGYWDPACPVSTDDPQVKATAYLKGDKVLVSVGNFAASDKHVRLDVDWNALGMTSADAVIEAPEIMNFQNHTTFCDGQSIPVRSKKGWLIIISRR